MIFIFEEITTKGFWDWIESFATILGNAGIFFITAYGFWLTYFSKNIKITSVGSSSSIYFGYAKNCTIYNKTLSPLIIEKIKIVYDNKYEVTIKDFKDEPLTIESFKAGYIKGDRYTSLSEDIDEFFAKDVYYKIETPGKELIIKSHGKINKKAKLITVCTSHRYFDNVVVSKDVRYVLIYWLKDSKEFKKVYILDNGMMDKNIFNFNVLPEEVLGNEKAMVRFFKNNFKNPDINFVIHDIDTKIM